eukprot:3935978-Rhodomonas_salina.3
MTWVAGAGNGLLRAGRGWERDHRLLGADHGWAPAPRRRAPQHPHPPPVQVQQGPSEFNPDSEMT